MASAQTLLTNLEAKRGKAYYDEFVALMSQVISDYATVSDRFIATSASTVTVGSGTKTFTLSATGKSFSAGSYVIATKSTDPTVYMIGQVTAFVDPALTISVASTSYGGSGSVSSWTIALSAAPINGDARYVQSSGGNASAAVVTPSGGSSALSLAAALGQWINVKWFGAKGDGTTDDTTAIQAAFNLAGLIGGTVVFPDGGTYCISSEIIAKITADAIEEGTGSALHFSDVRVVNVIGEGLATLKATASMTNMLRFTYDTSDSDIAPFYSKVEGLGFNGNSLATSGIYLEWCMHAAVEGNRIWGVTNAVTIYGYGVASIARNVISAAKGINIQRGGDNYISHNDFYPTNGGIGVYCGTYSGNTRVKDNIFSREQATGTLYGVHLDGTASSTGSEEVRNVKVSGNEFCGLTAGVYGTGHASVRNVYGCTIADNHVIPFSSTHTGTLATLSRCDAFEIRGNMIGSLSFIDATAQALSLSDCRRLTVEGNHIEAFTPTPVVITDCTDCAFVANEFNDTAKTGTSSPVVNIYGSSSARNTFRSNQLRQSSSSYGQIGIYEQSGVTGTVALDNDISGIGQPLRRDTTSQMTSESYGSAAPTSGTWQAGDRVYNQSPATGGRLGWVCVTAGTPGTWRPFGAIETATTGSVSFGDALANGGVVNAASASVNVPFFGRYTGADANGPVIQLVKNRGGAVVQAGDAVGGHLFYGYDGAANQIAAQMVVYVDGTPSSGAMPGRYAFFTTPTGSATPLERLRISADGSLGHRANATTVVDANSHLGLRSYTVATLPSASTAARLINVSDGASNKRLAISDGTNWRWPDGATVS